MNEHVRVKDEESTLSRELYFGNNYFKWEQLSSMCQQLIEINDSGCKSMLEIGKGNGFVSEFIRASGVEVTTCDINESLTPDIVCSIDDLDEHFGERQFEYVVCAEVLEHIPFEAFETSLRKLRRVSAASVLVTLPRNDRPLLHMAGRIYLPKLGYKTLAFRIPKPWRKTPLFAGHFWEINSHKHCKLDELRRIFKNVFAKVEDYRYPWNPYHQFFVCEV